MTEQKRKIMCIGLCLAMAGTVLTGCGSDETAGTEVRGRVTSISETEITLEITNQPGGERHGEGRPDGVSGSAVGRENRETESKTYSVSKNTKFYTQQGEDKTEVLLSDLQLDSMVTAVVSGDEAESITIQTRDQRQGEKTES